MQSLFLMELCEAAFFQHQLSVGSEDLLYAQQGMCCLANQDGDLSITGATYFREGGSSRSFAFLSKTYLFCLCLCALVCVWAVPLQIWGGHQILQNWTYYELWATIWVPGTEPRSSVRAANALMCWVISLAPCVVSAGPFGSWRVIWERKKVVARTPPLQLSGWISLSPTNSGRHPRGESFLLSMSFQGLCLKCPSPRDCQMFGQHCEDFPDGRCIPLRNYKHEMSTWNSFPDWLWECLSGCTPLQKLPETEPRD